VDLARAHGLDPAQLALAYVNSRRFVTSNIIGATNLQQLKTNIDSVYVELSDEVLTGIQQIHQQYPNPSP
jgi:aryl-alcohol dehydrogenase-like predicted oxidoreductase